MALRPPPRDACIFCGAGPVEAEHVMPKWLQKWGLEGRGEHTIVSGDESKTYFAPPFTQQYKVVCKDCNTGWMARLESVAAPLLKPLMDGHARSIETFVQPVLATWAYKTTLIQDTTMVGQKLWPPFYADLNLNRLPHATAQVWMGKYNWLGGASAGALDSDDGVLPWSYTSRKDRVRSPETGERLDSGPSMFYGVLSLGSVFFMTCVAHDPEQPALPISANVDFTGDEDKLLRLWPVSYSFLWPPDGGSFSISEFEEFRQPKPKEWPRP